MPDGGAIVVTARNTTFEVNPLLNLIAGNYVEIMIKDVTEEASRFGHFRAC